MYSGTVSCRVGRVGTSGGSGGGLGVGVLCPSTEKGKGKRPAASADCRAWGRAAMYSAAVVGGGGVGPGADTGLEAPSAGSVARLAFSLSRGRGGLTVLACAGMAASPSFSHSSSSPEKEEQHR